MLRWVLLLAALCAIGCLKGPTGPSGATGPKGNPGAGLSILSSTGTILAKNYTVGNPAYAALRICNCPTEPTVLFVGIENVNGVMTNTSWSGIGYSAGSDDYSVDGLAGYYVLVPDPNKAELQKNYKIKYSP